MKLRALSCLLLGGALLGCQDQQYVSPDTVRLSITDTRATPMLERVNRCNYIPVLLGDMVKTRYVVNADLKAVIAITRENVTVSFEGVLPDDEVLPEPWPVDSSKFRDKMGRESLDPPLENFDVVLTSPCVVDD